MQNTLLFLLSILLISGCMTISGAYQISEQNSVDESLTDRKFLAEGSGIYTVCNALCYTRKNAIIIIKDAKTENELSNEMPDKC